GWPASFVALAVGEYLVAIRGREDVERDRAVRLAVDELPHERVTGRAHFGRSALPDDLAGGHEVHVIDDLERFVDVMRDDHGRDAERVVGLSDELPDDAERNRIEPGERFVVED